MTPARLIRLLVSLPAGALLAGTLVACGGGTSAPRSSSGGGAFPVSIPNLYGTTVVRHAPKRVVVIGYHEADAVLALGVKPVAVAQFVPEFTDGVGPWARPKLGGTKPVVFPSSSQEIDIGAIAKLKPDLVIGTYRAVSRSEYQTLSKLAPTLVRPKRYDDYAVPYAVETEMIGKALGKERQAKALVAHTEADFAAARKAHPEFAGKQAAVVMPDPKSGGAWVYGSGDPRGEFLRKLGFTIPPAVDKAAGKQYAVQIGPERLQMLGKVDLLVVIGNTTDASTKGTLLGDLRVAERGRMLLLSYDDGLAITFDTALGIPYSIEHVVPKMGSTVAR